MATDHEANQSVAEKPVPSSEELDTSATDTPSSEATPAETEVSESNALSNDDAHPEPEKLEKAELGTFGSGCSGTIDLV
jgi:hypothetical protein